MPSPVTLRLRPPPPIPSPAHGRRPPPTSKPSHHSPPIQSCSSSAAPTGHNSFSRTALAPTDLHDASPEPEDCDLKPPLPTEQDWFRYPAPTKEMARLKLPMVDVLEQLEKTAKKGKGGLTKREYKMLGEWRVGESLGKGTSGHVRLARSTRTGEFAAIKKVKRVPPEDRHAKSVHREISLMKLVAPHPHLVELLDVFETPSHLYLVTEYCPEGELFHLIVKRQLASHEIHKFYTQLISALQHLSSFAISHRDVKFENLLLYEDERGELCLKLGDMGMASFTPEGDFLKTSCGSPHYAAPEVIKGILYDGSLADVWSSGVVLYTMFARRLPFDDEHIPTLLDKIKHHDYEMHESIEEPARDLIRRCLTKDVKKRISLKDVASHPYLRPMPFAAPPLTLEAISPPKPAAGPVPARVEELDAILLENLVIVLKVADVQEAREMVYRDIERARLFYSILRGFQQPRRPRPAGSGEYAVSIHVVDDQSLPVSVEPSIASLRRSLSAPDGFPMPPGLEPPAPPSASVNTARTDSEAISAMSPRQIEIIAVESEPTPFALSPTAGDSDFSPTHPYSAVNQQYSFPHPVPPTPTMGGTTITSAPPEVGSFAIYSLPISPLDTSFDHLPSSGRGSRGPRTRPSTAATATTCRSLPTSPLLHSDPMFAAAAAQAQAYSRPSIDNAGLRNLGPLQRTVSKRASMQQKLKSLFQAGGGAKRPSVSSVVEEKPPIQVEKVNQIPPPPIPAFPPPPRPPPTASFIPQLRPPSPAPSSRSSMLKRSSAYRSFGRALNGQPPKSPELAEFGEILSMGASASADARARHVARGGSSRLHALRTQVAKPIAFPPVVPEVHSFFDSRSGKLKASSTPTPVQSPSTKRRRPLPLTLKSMNAANSHTSTPALAAPSPGDLFKRASRVGIGRPPNRPATSPHQIAPPAVVIAHAPLPSPRPVPEPSSPDDSDPEDPFSLVTALRQYPYRTASYGSTRSSAGSAVNSYFSFRNISGSTGASSQPPTTTLSARSPRIGEEMDDSASFRRLSGSSGYASSYTAALRRQRDLEAELRKVQLENKLLQAAVEARDDELQLLRRSERRLTQCVEKGESVVKELSAEREELEELVRRLDWEKHRSFFEFEQSLEDGRGGAGAGGGRGAEGYGQEEGREEEREEERVEGRVDPRLERKMREDQWLQSLRRKEEGWRS
ncbi:hypothetical protein JCM11641_008149 [Rhodosporidiobolus odoratus]